MKPLRQLALCALLTAGLLAAATPAASTPATSPATPALVPVATTTQQAAALRTQVQRALSGSTARLVGVSIDVDGLGAVDRTGASLSLPPASTEKLFTTLAALERLGPGYVYRTALRTSATRSGGHLRGDLWLLASGDPYLTSAHLKAMVAALVRSGITAIDGHLRLDDHRYDRVRSGPGWKGVWVPEESGPLSAMALDRNAWRQDRSFLADPATPAIARLRSSLSAAGISVRAPVSLGTMPAGTRVLVRHTSAPLSAVVRRINKDSDNFAAEELLKELGRVQRGSGTTGSGAAAVHAVLGPLGVSTGTTTDGSGLGPGNRKTPAGLQTLLRVVQSRSTYPALRASLPIACRDGTLLHRFCGTAAAVVTQAKTGTLDTGQALSGWSTTRDGHLVRFALLLSSYTDGAKVRAAMDRAVVLLAAARLDS